MGQSLLEGLLYGSETGVALARVNYLLFGISIQTTESM